MRCASYTRYTSCVYEKEIPSDIIKQQNERIQKYIKSNGWELAEKYADRKKDAEAEDAFREMQRDGINRKFDMVVIDSIFRCGVNVSYAEDVLLKTFYPAGIHFAVVEDNFCSMFMNADDVKAYFSKKRSFAASNNMHQYTWRRTAEGYLTVHDEKYGYLLTADRKGLVIDEEVAPIIREIFHLLADKEMTYKQVCALMNERGYESPMAHITRVGLKSRPEVESKWVPPAVKRIAENTAYIGYWYKYANGERITVITEPIVEKEKFDKIKARYEKSPTRNLPRAMRSDNAFIKQIFDKASGATMLCKLHKEDEPYQTFSLGFWDSKHIPYDTVMLEVVAFLREEQRKAKAALRYILSDAGISEMERQREVIAGKARIVFNEMAELAEERMNVYHQMVNEEISEAEFESSNNILWSQLCVKEKLFAELMEQVDTLEKIFSKHNPWVELYSGINIPDTLKKEHIRKWVDRVLVEDTEKVEIILPKKYTDWRDMLPAECLKEGE